MNILKILILTPTPPTNIKNSTSFGEILIFALPILLLFIIFCLCCSIYNKNKTIKTLQRKSFPAIYTNNATHDVIVISNDDYNVISIRFLIYDAENNFVKEYTVQEYHLRNGEQRLIANTSEFSEFKITYEIIDCKEKV